MSESVLASSLWTARCMHDRSVTIPSELSLELPSHLSFPLSYCNTSTVPPAIFAAMHALACQILSQKSILTAAPRAPAGPGPCLALVRALALPDSAGARSQLPAASCRMATGTIFAASQAGSPSCMHGCMHGISLWMHGCDAEFWLAGCLLRARKSSRGHAT